MSEVEHYMDAVARLRGAVSQAITDLDASHYPMYGEGAPTGCELCWPKDRSWPCASRMVADDLRDALDPAHKDASQ